MAITRLSVDGYGARRAGSFAGRAESVPPAVEETQPTGGFYRYPYRKRRRYKLPDDEEVQQVAAAVVAEIATVPAEDATVKNLEQAIREKSERLKGVSLALMLIAVQNELQRRQGEQDAMLAESLGALIERNRNEIERIKRIMQDEEDDEVAAFLLMSAN